MKRVRLKHVAEIIMGQSPASEDVNEAGIGIPFLQGNGEFGSMNPHAKAYCDISTKKAVAGDLLLSVRAPVGAINIADREYGIGRGLCAIRSNPSRLERRFAAYAILAKLDNLKSVAVGSTYDAVTTSDVGILEIDYDDIHVQIAIADFLDRETAEADALVAKYQRLIELLEEKRVALVTQAVTKGLDPSVPMKNSGVEWIGDIPRHWTVKPLKRLLTSPLSYGVLKPDYTQDEDFVELINIWNISDNQVLRNGLTPISRQQSQEYKRTVVCTGDLVYSIVGTLGRAAVIMTDFEGCNLSRNLARIQLNPAQVDAEFVRSYLISDSATNNIQAVTFGSAQQHLNLGDLDEFPIPVPPMNEQRSIASSLAKQLSFIADATMTIKLAASLAREHCSALITVAVTGQIDVGTYRSKNQPIEVPA